MGGEVAGVLIGVPGSAGREVSGCWRTLVGHWRDTGDS